MTEVYIVMSYYGSALRAFGTLSGAQAFKKGFDAQQEASSQEYRRRLAGGPIYAPLIVQDGRHDFSNCFIERMEVGE